MFIAGAAVQWFRDGLKVIGAAPEIGALALQGDPDSEVTFVPALTGLGAPHWQPSARGTLFGLSNATTLADIARAALEGVAFQIADVIETIQDDLGSALTELRVDGGMARSDAFLQFQADVLAGLWNDRAGAVKLLESGVRTFTPARGYAWRSRAMERWRRAVETVIGHYHKEHPAR